jgi:putative membrane protein insertion efficiency factor
LARVYVRAVRGYQTLGRPLLAGRIQCRYVPSCSEYSLEAVSTYGLGRGLVLSVSRLQRCQRRVPRGTPDPLEPRPAS